MKRCVITGAGGFIGNALVTDLVRQGNWVKGVDVKYPEYSTSSADEFITSDLRDKENCLEVTKDNIDEVYNLSAHMGGIGFIYKYHADIMHNNALIDLNMLEASRINRVNKFLFSSSACIYPLHLQTETNIRPLKENDAYPAQPEDAYGTEKLFMEELCKHYRENYNIDTKVVRFHNIYGPLGTWTGGKEKSPAALCRKVAMAKLKKESEIEIWGDGEQTRSFCYIDDCVKGLQLIMNSEHHGPFNLGRDDMISINDLAKLIMKIADYQCEIKHVKGTQGVRGRNSDNLLFKSTFGWEPQISLENGLTKLYNWIDSEVKHYEES